MKRSILLPFACLFSITVAQAATDIDNTRIEAGIKAVTSGVVAICSAKYGLENLHFLFNSNNPTVSTVLRHGITSGALFYTTYILGLYSLKNGNKALANS